MAFVPDSTELALGVNSALNKATQAVTGFLSPQTHSAEYALLSGPLRDPRLAPRVPMENGELDMGLLSQLSAIGLKRGKQVSYESHPELMRAWKAMSQRAGLAAPPQLIIAESDSMNALTVTPQEVVVTTGLLKVLDMREAVAVLGHELGHITSDHVKPRLFWMGALGGAGALAGNQLGRAGGLGMMLTKLGTRWPFAAKLQQWIYGAAHVPGTHSSVLGSLVYMAAGITVGGYIANNLSVNPTELDADAKGAAISGDPQGLANALHTLHSHSAGSSWHNTKERLKKGYPTLEKRVANLQNMANQPGAPVPVIAEVEAHPEKFAPTQHSREPRFAVSDIASAERLEQVPGPAIA